MRTRTAVVLATLLAAGLTGCGHAKSSDGVASVTGSGGPSASASPSDARTDQQRLLDYAQCMRDNGVTNFPDPQFDGSGHVQLMMPQGVDKSVVDAAQAKCQQLMPNGGEAAHMDPQQLAQARQYSQCMRDHGVTNFPDPNENGGIQINGDALGMSPDDPTFKAADAACQSLMGSKPLSTRGAQG